MRFTRVTIRPAPIERTNKRIKAAEKAVKKELDKFPLFPEMYEIIVKFRNILSYGNVRPLSRELDSLLAKIRGGE